MCSDCTEICYGTGEGTSTFYDRHLSLLREDRMVLILVFVIVLATPLMIYKFCRYFVVYKEHTNYLLVGSLSLSLVRVCVCVFCHPSPHVLAATSRTNNQTVFLAF
jgi:hypothetical protein